MENRYRCKTCQQYVDEEDAVKRSTLKCPDCNARLDEETHPVYIQ